jgi:hypothetical protein
MLALQSFYTARINKKSMKEICFLKNSKWKNGFKENLNWFKKNAKSRDLHNLLFFNKKLVGYTMLRLRKFKIKRNFFKYYYFDTLIIDKKYRGKKISSFLMHFNNYIIKKKKLHSFLICRNGHVKYYKKFGWKKVLNNMFNLMDHKVSKNFDNSLVNGMVYNLKKKNKSYYYLN